MLRVIARGLLCLAALFAGCKGGQVSITDDYGVPPPPSHPTVVLTDFTYTPAGSVRVGDTLKLLATTNLPVADASMRVHVSPVGEKVILNDDGEPPDEAALDGTWTAQYTWPQEEGPAADAYFRASLRFNEYYMWQSLTTPRFEVLPAEDAAP